jgi:hypothetical protein
MSDSEQGQHYTYEPTLTPGQFQELGDWFKRMFANEPWIKVAIYAAGIGGALEGIHIVWLFLKAIYPLLSQ